MDNFADYWNEKIYNSLPEILFEKDLPSWGFSKNITQAKKIRKSGKGPRYLKLESGTIILSKEFLIAWHRSLPEEKRPILRYPKKVKKKPKIIPKQMEFDFG